MYIFWKGYYFVSNLKPLSMKRILLVATLFISIGAVAQSVTIDSIPNPECLGFNLSEPGLAISSTGKIYYGGKNNSFYSTDMGATWDTSTYNWFGGIEVGTVEISPVNGNVYIGGSRFAMSTDGGATYESQGNFTCLDIYAAPNGNVFVILDGGLFIYTTPDLMGGRTLLLSASSSFQNISIGNHGEMFAVGKEKIYISLDSGQTWQLKKEITSGNNEYRHVIAGAGNDIFYGETNVNLHKTDTTFVPDVIVPCYTGANSIKTPSGFMFFPEKGDWWSFSFDNGASFVKYYGSGFAALVNGATVPRMSFQERNVDGLAVYNDKIYYAGSNCVIIVLSAGSGGIGIEEKKTESLLSVFPNPVSKMEPLNVKGIESSDQLVIRDILGKEIASFMGVSQINIQDYKSGVYSLTVFSKNKNETVKFIVE